MRNIDYYFDYYSTTPISMCVIKYVSKFSSIYFANINSFSNIGTIVFNKIHKYRTYIANFINAHEKEIIFTSGATESNNIAIQGIIKSCAHKIHVICSKYVHDSVINVLTYYINMNIIDITWICVSTPICANVVQLYMRENTKFVICDLVNHEIGMINDVNSIGEFCFNNSLFFHVDAAQAYGKIHIDVKQMLCSTLSFSGHKIYCYKGIGGLYVAHSPRRIRLSPILFGGNQQKYRSGTIANELIAGLYIATKLCKINMAKEYNFLRKVQLWLHNNIMLYIPNVILNGNIDSSRIHNNLNYSFYGIEGESIVMLLNCKNIYVSTGSACRSNTLQASETITAISGIENAHSSVRISFGRFTTLRSVKYMFSVLKDVVSTLRHRSPIQ